VLSEKRITQIRAWQKANPEKVKAAKKRYYATEKGKAQKRKEDKAYVASGGRSKIETLRATKPLSEARKQARLRYQIVRRSFEKNLSEIDKFVLNEAVSLTRLRNKIVGGCWHVDHIVPVSKGGTCVFSNLQVVPALWNQSKSNVHTERYFGAFK